MDFTGERTLKPLVVVGSVNLDLVLHVDRIPGVGETLLALGQEEFLGGKGANQAVAAAKLGVPVEMIGRVGDDTYGERLRDGLREAGVGAAAVAAVAGPSGLAIILHALDGANSIVVQPGANASLTPDDIEERATIIDNASALLLQLETPMDSVAAAARLAHAHGVPVILDPAPAQPLPPELLAATTWLTPNETEAQSLTGLQTGNPGQIAERLLALGARNVALKLGERGAFLAGADCEPTHIPAMPVVALDTTAAGDCFNAAFAARLVAGDPPPAAARYACAAAALCITRAGAQASMPTAAEVDQFLSQQH